MKNIPVELRIPGEDLVAALKEQPNLDKVTLSALSTTLKRYGVKDAYRKVQQLPRKSPCRLDTRNIIKQYGTEDTTVRPATEVVKVDGNTQELSASSQHISATDSPEILNRVFVKTTSYKELEGLLKGDHRLNLFINGDSGLGKTSNVLDILRKQKREAIRFNCSYHQDVDDFIGGHRLVNGDTVYFDGAVVVAQERGAALILDEVDAADPKLLFEIQSILEGNGVLLKKIGRMSYPAPGFQVIATGNTKGRGDLTGDFTGTNILNKSFLDRFDAGMTWEAPNESEMDQILEKNSELPPALVALLAKWYQGILTSVIAGVHSQMVSPRRMISIAKLCENANVDDPTSPGLMKAVKASLNGFDEDIRDALVDMLDMHISALKKESIPEAKADEILSGDEPF